MHLRRLAPFFLLAALVLAGCNTVSSRIRQKEAVFASLPATEQARLRKGEVAIGDTPDMVYIALGAPDRHVERTTADASGAEWIYDQYVRSYEGTRMVGYRRVVAVDPHTGRRFIYHEPAFADVYRERTEDRLRIVFTNGRVATIEELKR